MGPEILVQIIFLDGVPANAFHIVKINKCVPHSSLTLSIYSHFLINIVVIHPHEITGNKIPVGNMLLIPRQSN